MCDNIDASLKSMIDKEHAIRNSASFPRVSEREIRMTPDERKKEKVRSANRYRLQYKFRAYVDNVLKVTQNPKYLLAVPYRLSRDYELGTNAVMHTITSNEVTSAHLSRVEEFHTRIWLAPRAYEPDAQQLLHHFQRDIHSTCAIAECYWLLELADWAGCLTPHSAGDIEAVFDYSSHGEHFDFLRILDAENEKDLAALEEIKQLYDTLEELFGRFYSPSSISRF